MFARRRPLLRAAVVGGSAYMAGKRQAERSAQQQDQEAGQDIRISDLGQGQQGAGGTGASGYPAVPQQAGPPSMADQLSRLSDLHAQGALTDAEFASAKSRLLRS
jgi:hypothetical protein